jgi:hypothetical protein
LYARFEAMAPLTKAVLHSELFHRIRTTQAQRRWTAVRALLDRMVPKRTAQERNFAGANIRHFLSATTWHYYRVYFGFSLEDSIQCARLAIAQALEGLRVPAPDRAGAPRRGVAPTGPPGTLAP